MNVWQQIKKPFVGMAPMDGITDFPFREIVCKYSTPDLVFTEFVNVEGLCHNAQQLLRPLLLSQQQRPIIAQLFGKTPEAFYQAAILVCALGFDGVDINMGCPAKTVAGGGSGAGLIENPELAIKIIQTVKDGVEAWAQGADCSNCPDFSEEFCKLVAKQAVNNKIHNQNKQSLPVSVKTRIGTTQVDYDWLSCLLEAAPSTLTIHGRTTKQAYKGQANWEVIGKVLELAKANNSNTLIIGNGDITPRKQGEKLAKQYQLDGVLIGRAVQGNPFVFLTDDLTLSTNINSLAMIALEHASLFEKTFTTWPKYSFLPMRKHLAWYIKGVPQAKEIRQELVQTNSSEQVQRVFEKYQLL